MPFSNPQNSITIPTGATTGPRIVIGTDIPASLVAAYGAGFTISAAIVDYYSTTDFFFTAIGTSAGVPVLRTGALIGGTLLRYEEYAGGNAIDGSVVFYGSVANPGGTNWVYRNGEIVLSRNFVSGEQVVLSRDNIGTTARTDIVPASPIAVAQINNASQIASNAAAEQVFASAVYSNGELTGDFEDGHYFKVTLTAQHLNNNGLLNTGRITIRQGSASTVGNTLAIWRANVINSAAVAAYYEAFFRNNTGADKLAEPLSICYHRETGAGIVNIHGDATFPLQLSVYDLGAQVINGFFNNVRDMT